MGATRRTGAVTVKPPVLVSGSGATAASGLANPNTLAVNQPAGIANGDLLVAVVYAGATGVTFGAPSGWAQQGATQNTANGSLAVYTHTVASDVGTYNFTENSTGFWTVGINAFRGTSGIDGAPVFQNGLGTTITNPSATASQKNDAWLVAWGVNASNYSYFINPNTPVGATWAPGAASGTPGPDVASWSTIVSAGPTGTSTNGPNTSEKWSAVSLLVKGK